MHRTINPRARRKALMLATTAVLVVGAGAASAQDATGEDARVDDIVVVGSQIRGATVTAALPVTVVGEEEITNTAATSGDDLFRAVPQMGDVTFNSAYLPGTSNSARGDTASVNLRNLGVGNTLVLLNGRRVVGHPTSQANEHLVPVIGYNTNAIPVSGLRRLEVLRDGAAAIYGADAVAGVVNTVLRDDMNDWSVSAQYGGAEASSLREFNLNVAGGTDFADGRGNVSVFASYDERQGTLSTDQTYTSSLDRRGLFGDTRFGAIAGLDGRATTTPWGQFQTVRPGVITRSGLQLTNGTGQFHIQPATLANCRANLGNGICVDAGALATSGAERDLRYDSDAQGTSVIPDLQRGNLFVTGKYDLTDNVTAFGEVGVYYAQTNAIQAPISTLSSIVLTIPAHSYWNPFGPVTFANGQANPNRLSGLTNVPVEGLAVQLRGYSFADLGPINIEVTNQQYRLLGGLRGQWRGWDWETAIVHSEARAEDVSDNISTTALFRQLSLSTPEAYNPFAGGNLGNFSVGGSGRQNPAAVDAIRQSLTRVTETSLTMADFRFSRPDLFTLPGGDLGMAGGVEFRHETQLDDRDDRITGDISFTDTSGAVYGDFINSALNPDIEGERDVFSAYLEFAVPIVSPEMGVPLVHRLEAQVAGRYENYSDFGNVTKPKVAVAWDLFDGLRLRGSWAQAFRAPNLEQVNATVITRSNTSMDWSTCQALVNSGAMVSPGVPATMQNCSSSYLIAERRSGNPDLKAEESETLSLGVVLTPPTPSDFGAITFTADWWRVEQEGMVGLFRGQNALILDYVLRNQGSSNPNVVREAPTVDEIALFTAAGLAPAGRVLHVLDRYDNLLPQTIEGVDVGVFWRLRGTRLGDFSLNLNVAHLLEYYLQPSPAIQDLLDAQTRGEIAPNINFGGTTGDMLRQNAKPDWKWSLSGTWSNGPWTVGAFTSYTGSVESTAAALNDAQGPWIVEAQQTLNLYGEYEFQDGLASGTRIRVGARNITDEAPPLAAGGYNGLLYQPYARYWYVNIRKTF